MSYLIDSHCHIPMIEKQGGAEAVIHAARQAGVGRMLCVSTELASFPQIKRLADAHECVAASVGVHPNTDETLLVSEDALLQLADDPAVVAIGETGLDYFRSQGDLHWQRERFRTHIRAAKALNKPLIIHSREAKADVLGILKEEGAEKVGGVMHCFVDDLTTAREAIDLNFYISFSGIVTFKNAQALQDTARQLPLNNMLIETDAPFLAPVPHRGQQNEPAYVRFVAEKIAELQEVALDEVMSITQKNYERLFAH